MVFDWRLNTDPPALEAISFVKDELSLQDIWTDGWTDGWTDICTNGWTD